MIEVRELVKRHGALSVLCGVSLTVPPGEVAAVIGPSGGGKSTLLALHQRPGALPVRRGARRDLALRPGKTESATLQSLRRRVGMVFPAVPPVPAPERARERDVPVRCTPRGPAAHEGRAGSASVARSRGLARRSAPAGSALGRAATARCIARALAVKPEAILFDEPTSDLDPRMAVEVLRVMEDLGERWVRPWSW